MEDLQCKRGQFLPGRLYLVGSVMSSLSVSGEGIKGHTLIVAADGRPQRRHRLFSECLVFQQRTALGTRSFTGL